MRHSPINSEALKKVAVLLRDHSLPQIANTLHYACHAVCGFPLANLPYRPVWLVITPRCNLRCGHCSYGSPDSPREALDCPEMSLRTFARVLDRFPRAIAVGLGAAEPFLHPRVFDMARLAHRRRKKVHLPTNGTLLGERLDEVLDSPVDFLNVSLYGTDGEGFAELTGGRPDAPTGTAAHVGSLAAAAAALSALRGVDD